MTNPPAYADEDVQTCIDWLYSAMHDDRQVPEMAENLLEDLVPRIVARAKAEALREFADHIQDGEWPMPPDVGHVAMEAHARADEIEAGR